LVFKHKHNVGKNLLLLTTPRTIEHDS